MKKIVIEPEQLNALFKELRRFARLTRSNSVQCINAITITEGLILNIQNFPSNRYYATEFIDFGITGK